MNKELTVLEWIRELKKFGTIINLFTEEGIKNIEIIENSLKALEFITNALKDFYGKDFEEYLKHLYKKMALTQEEYDLLKEVLL